jgi:hypothetical protein
MIKSTQAETDIKFFGEIGEKYHWYLQNVTKSLSRGNNEWNKGFGGVKRIQDEKEAVT